MNIAIMQPYFFPYLGYYQLARSVDCFVFLDDVSFIKKGFINRNRILLNNEPFQFVVPVSRISQNRAINEHYFIGEFSRFLLQVRHAYHEAPHFAKVYELVENVCGAGDMNVARKAALSIDLVFDYLGLRFNHCFSSELNLPIKSGVDRLMDICEHLHAGGYHNAMGGQDMYSPIDFAERGISLRFVKGNFPAYQQHGQPFVSALSMIDVLMFNDRVAVVRMLEDYELVCTEESHESR